MIIERSHDVRRWHVVHTNPREEERATYNLTAWGVETLYPKQKSRRYNRFTGAATYVTQPLFPRYIFAKFNAYEQLPKISFTRGVHSVVRFGENLASVDEDIIQIIHARIDKNGFVKAGEDLKRGDKVIINAGPMRSLMGIFERELKGKERIIVLLEAVSYQGRVVVNRDVVERATC